MPPRIFTCLIVAFWLTTMGWFTYREWWPRFQDSIEPPFTIELADEATPQNASWTLYQDQTKLGRATTSMRVKGNDSFELQNQMSNIKTDFEYLGRKVPIKVKNFSTTQQVNREGKLLSIASNVQIEIAVFDGGPAFEVKSEMNATVKDGKLYPHIASLDAILIHLKNKPLAPVDLPSRSMWNPMEPVSRIRVRPGQRWRMCALSPLEDAIENSMKQLLPTLEPGAKRDEAGAATAGFKPPQLLEAEVLREPRELSHEDQKYLCYVIEYRDSADITRKLVARTWIQVADAKVIRQEAIQMTGTLILQRND
jgi:hypothetical protein